MSDLKSNVSGILKREEELKDTLAKRVARASFRIKIGGSKPYKQTEDKPTQTEETDFQALKKGKPCKKGKIGSLQPSRYETA
jgi:hypothetical protein